MSERMKILNLKDDEFDWLCVMARSVYLQMKYGKKTVPEFGVFLFRDSADRTEDFGINHLGWEDWPSFIAFCRTGKYPE